MKTERTREFLGRLGYGPAPESDKAARAWLAKHAKVNHFVGGAWRDPANGQYFQTVNPANYKDVLAQVAVGCVEDVDAAMQAAQTAFPAWSALTGFERAKFLYAIARAIAKHSRILAVLETLDNGKTIRETRDIDIPLVIRHFYYHAGLAMTRDEQFRGFKPGGVVGQIIPWNFPLLMLAWKIAPAIAAGNTVVLKPAEFTPLTAAFFAELLATEVGLPPGVVNIVFGAGSTGEAMVKHPVPWKIAFTGSTEVGRLIRKATAGSGKKLTMELGGKSPFIVFADSDLDAVVEGVVDAIWFNQGQVCCAGSRLLVEEGIAPLLVKKLKRRMQTLRGGNPLDKTMDFGAMNSEEQYRKVVGLIERGKAEGAQCFQAECDLSQSGWFVPPTLFTDVDPADTIARVEIFGPVLVVMTFRTPDEAVQLANNTPYGLAASVWTQNIAKAMDIARRLKAGTVWINSTNLFDAASGFGGYRESGYGREGGLEGFYDVLVEDGSNNHQDGVQVAGPDSTIARMARAAGALVGSSEPIDSIEGLYERVQPGTEAEASISAIDRTHRFLIGGGLKRPDGGESFTLKPNGRTLATLGNANRKDVRDAVEAAAKAQPGWQSQTAHLRAQILYFLAENLSQQRERLVNGIMAQTGCVRDRAEREFDTSIERLFLWAGYADKFGGTVQPVATNAVVLGVREPIGVIGIRPPDELPLLGLVNTIGPAIAMGNTVVVIAGKHGLTASDLIQVIQNSDVPGGVVNIMTAKDPDGIARLFAEHMAVDSVWCFGTSDAGKAVELASAGNMKRTFVPHHPIDMMGVQGSSELWLRDATQVKNVWVPVGS